MEYDFRKIEKAWQQHWREKKTYAAENNTTKPKCYVLDMFPYPSGAGLHVGHPLGYIASDIYARYKRLKGFNVLHPMGYDSFGLPAEQYAIQTGQHPALTTEQNIARYREQLDNIGFSFDWDREVRTSNADYYKWTQWIFIRLFHSWYNHKKNKAEPIETLIDLFESEGFSGTDEHILTGDIEKQIPPFTAAEWKSYSEKQQQEILLNFRLTYLSESMVNWCPALGTVLANDEVKDGLSERGGHPVIQKMMLQWSMRITAYADRLLEGLDTIDWPESVKEAQRNWIGKSEGSSIEFGIWNLEFRIEVFTTRPDTIFGVSFVTLAPEHELVEKITTPAQKAAVEAYVEMAKSRTERERMADVKRISGEFTGAFAIHPFTGKQIPIWIGDYVLAGYGTGAVMAVPAHDSRDFAFATHFNLSIIKVIQPPMGYSLPLGEGQGGASYDAKEGTLVNSDFLNGLQVKHAIKRSIEEIEKRGYGKKKINYRQRDAVFGRQRYWGEPIPVYYKEGISYTLPENELPLVLPEVDKYLPTEDGEPPLARAANWSYKGYPLETTTMPGWAGSSWYFFRYMDAHNAEKFAGKEAINYWQDVDLYIGGAEHSTGHLLYARFWTKFLYDLGYVPKDEFAKKLINQGMIQGVSEFIYRVSILYGGEKVFSNEVFVSNQIAKDIIKWHKESIKTAIYHSLENALSVILKKTLMKEVSGEDITIEKEVSPIHVDVNIVKNGVLEIRALKKWRPEYENAIFIFENENNATTLNEVEGTYYCGSEVEKMSKSKWNVVSPDVLIENFGADTLRMYEMFLGPLEQSKPWNTNGITGVHNFLRKFWRLFHNEKNEFVLSEEAPTRAELKSLHKTIKKVAEDIDRFSFNTSVSSFMICCNELTDLKCNKRSILEPLIIILSPYAPHMAEMLWAKLKEGEKFNLENIPADYQSVNYAAFPEFKEEYLAEDAFEYPVSFNGKTKCKINLSLKLNTAEVEKAILAHADVQRVLNGGGVKKVIVVPGRIVNIVI